MKKRLSLIMVLVTLIVAIFLTSGVYGTWYYTTESADENFIAVRVGINNFFWEGAEELPDNPLIGESHFYLVENILDDNIGFNNPRSYLNQVVESRIEDAKDNVSSVAPTKGGNLKPLFSSSEIEKLDFMIIIYIENGQPYAYDLYTFETIDKGTQENVIVSPVFKTVVEKVDGEFKAIRSYKGSARTMYYDTNQGSGKDCTVNPNTWNELAS